MRMVKVEVFENRRPVLGINSLGRIGKLTLWHHIGRKYFQGIVVNLGRGAGNGLPAIAQLIEKDATYGTIHRFLYGIKAERMIRIVDENIHLQRRIVYIREDECFAGARPNHRR